MNKHTKIALIIAPFLAIGGYIATAYYADAQINKERFLPLTLQDKCHIKQGDCSLSNGQLQLNLSQTTAGIELTTTHPINYAVISLVDGENKDKLYALKPTTNRLNWQLSRDLFENRSVEKLRLLITIHKMRYLAEINVSVH